MVNVNFYNETTVHEVLRFVNNRMTMAGGRSANRSGRCAWHEGWESKREGWRASPALWSAGHLVTLQQQPKLQWSCVVCHLVIPPNQKNINPRFQDLIFLGTPSPAPKNKTQSPLKKPVFLFIPQKMTTSQSPALQALLASERPALVLTAWPTGAMASVKSGKVSHGRVKALVDCYEDNFMTCHFELSQYAYLFVWYVYIYTFIRQFCFFLSLSLHSIYIYL